MSSRVRLLLQDFMQNTSWTGKTAYAALEALYKRWLLEQAKPQKSSKTVWKQVSQDFASAHPFSCSHWPVEPKGAAGWWTGPGFYHKQLEAIEQPAGPVPALPPGPKWLQALEMWARLQPTYADKFRLFVSRDNKRHAWKHSLCNPWVQQWGYKGRLPKDKKLKKRGAKKEATGGIGNWPEDYIARIRNDVVQTEAALKPAVKPRVGIWI